MIIGLTGYARSGKDTLCQGLENYERAAFADALKAQVTKMLAAVGIEADLWGKDKEDWRDYLIFWGAKMRSRDPDYWIKQLFMRIAPVVEKRICITDVRYVNELEWVTRQGGIVIGITRPGYRAAGTQEAESIAEIRIRHPEIPWLVNNGTPEDLAAHARLIIRGKLNGCMKGRVLY